MRERPPALPRLMAFLTPLALLLALLALPIILLYMLRLRRREVQVSSTLLWQKLLRDRQANAPWQRLRRNLLLILQLLILAALVLALARPFVRVPSVVSGSVVVILDGSASMQATDVAPSRFEAARNEVARWIDDLGANDRMTLILAGRTPTVLASASGDREALRQALAEARPEAAPADWPAALSLAGGAAQGVAESRVVVISDGGLPEALPSLPADVIYVPVGQSDANLALSALAARGRGGTVELFAAVSNPAGVEQETLVSISLDGALFDSRRVSIPAGGTRTLTWQLPGAPGAISAQLSEQTEDYLSLDDRAWTTYAGGTGNRVLLVTEGNVFLEQVLGLLPGLETFRAPAGESLPPQDEPYDLYVFDGSPLPETVPDGDLLIVNPVSSPDDDLFSVTGTFSNTTVMRLRDSPLLQFVEWQDVNVRAAQAVGAPWAQSIVEAEGGPLLLAGEQEGRRVVIITFDLRDSDLPLRIAFPVLMANITDWLHPGRAFDEPATLQPGQAVAISPGAGSTAVLVERPDGTQWVQNTDGEDSILFEETSQQGLYRVTLRDAGGERPAGTFAVNLFAPQESDIGPAPALQLGQRTVEAPENEDVGRRELWPWLAAAAFVILVVEWWVYYRGARLPQLDQIVRRVTEK